MRVNYHLLLGTSNISSIKAMVYGLGDSSPISKCSLTLMFGYNGNEHTSPGVPLEIAGCELVVMVMVAYSYY